MSKSVPSSLAVWGIRCLAACAIVVSLGAGSFALTYAQGTTPTSTPAPGTTGTAAPAATAIPAATTAPVTDPTALTSSNSTTTFTCATSPCDHATITAYLSGVPAGAFSVVQWRDTAGNWINVDSWQAQLGMVPSSGVPFVQWAVLPNQYGTGPYRWVFHTSQGGALWGISPTFNLPTQGGADFAMFLTQPGKAFVNPMLGNPAVPTNAPLLESSGGMMNIGGFDDHSDILVYIPQAPASAWISVQWLDGFGGWHDVDGWQGTLDLAAGSNLPFKQWTVLPGQFDQGPFRWVVYNQRGGEVWGISPSFKLPQWGGLKYATFLRPAATTTTPSSSITAGAG